MSPLHSVLAALEFSCGRRDEATSRLELLAGRGRVAMLTSDNRRRR